ncbi:MAG: NADH-quinone oxidoreductase subunit NuoE [Christensenellaceae bacterium]|nr:NADH-quinone oxidoreductase subunit NuoE [Christensenellaceae bacterium]
MTTAVDDKAVREEFIRFIEEQKKKPGPLMPIMQKAQSLFGALTIEVQELISEQLGIPMSDVYGVATFYSQFALEPKGEHIISVCMGTACYVRNAEKVLDRLSEELGVSPGGTTPDRKFTLEPTRCLGCCGLAPVIMIDDQVFGRLTPSDVPEVLAKFK